MGSRIDIDLEGLGHGTREAMPDVVPGAMVIPCLVQTRPFPLFLVPMESVGLRATHREVQNVGPHERLEDEVRSR